MTLEFQHEWKDLIAIYLFLGGLGGACLSLASIAVYSKRILPIVAPWTSLTLGKGATAPEKAQNVNRTFTLTMSLSGVVFLGVGSLMLLFDLLHPEAVFYLLSNPSSWIFWGTIFISLTLVFGAIYGWAQATPTLRWVGGRLGDHWLGKFFHWLSQVGHALQRVERFSGLVAGWFGFATAFYTGFLVSMAPAIPFWHTPALPLLFLVSAFSTASAYALLCLSVMRHYQQGLEQRVEGFDVGLIVFELLIVITYFNFSLLGSLGARASVSFLLGQPGFWGGVLLLGLVVPLGLEFFSLYQHGKNPRLHTALSVVSGVLVLAGGYLLRYYILAAGVFELPW